MRSPETPVFTYVREELIHQGFVVAFFKRFFTAPDGTELSRDVVKHPGAVAAVALEDGGVWLVYQFRAALNKYLWEIPAGKIDKAGENPTETIRREMEEEIGKRAASIELLQVMHNSAGFCDERLSIFLAQDLTTIPSQLEGPEEEAMKVELIPMAEALQMISDGTITDAKTLIGLMAASRRLGM